MNTSFNPKRLLLETLLLVALAEISVMLILPVLAPGLGTLGEGLLDVAMLLLLTGPVVYWRFMVAFKRDLRATPPTGAAYGKTNHAVVLTLATQVIGLLLTASGVWWQSKNLEAFNHSRFDRSVERIESEVVRRFNQPVYGLKGARGAIAANPHFQRKEFRAYVESRDLPNEFPGIRGFGFIQRVQRPDLERFVAAQRADGAPDYTVHTSGTAPDLFVVQYVEPMVTNRAALGFDLGQDSVRRAAVEYAMNTGETTLLSGIALRQDETKSPAMLFLLPIYRPGSKAQTVEQRQHDFLGLLYVPMVTSELLSSVVSSADNQIDFELFDGAEADPDKLLFDEDGELSVSRPGQATTTKTRKFTAQRVLLSLIHI